MSKKWIRRFLVTCEPIGLGQTSSGFILAAVLVFLWLVARPIEATAAPIVGYSEDQYLRIDWEWDLAAGRGTLSFTRKRDSDYYIHDFMQLGFITAGLDFDSRTGSLGDHFLPGQDIGEVGGRSLFQQGFSPYDSTSAIAFPYALTAIADVTFSSEGVEVFETDISYEALLFHEYNSSMRLASNTLDFVSIQTIPEPATAAGLLLGGAGAVAAMRRRRDGRDIW